MNEEKVITVRLSDNNIKPPETWGAVPGEGQLYYHKQEMAAFVHYGINSFTNQEWGSGDYTTDLFDIKKPDGTGGGTVDAEQWVSILKGAGFKRLILVAKHHDGFCFWPTFTTAHNVSNAPSSDDIVLKVSAACRNHDMDMGIYLSPWDMKADKEGNFGAVYTAAEAGDNRELIGKPDIDKYNNYYMAQLKELLGNPDYGGKDNRFVEVWMDGAKGWGKAQDYYFTDYHKDYWVEKYGLSRDENRTSWRNVIYSPYNGHYNENMVILAPYGDMVRWIGNENGTAGVPCWSKVNRADQRDKFLRDNGEDIHLQNHGDPEGCDWSVPETNTPIYEGGKWFYAENEDGTPKWEPKSIRELARVYFSSVGRGTVLLLNASPGTDGKIDKAQAARFKQFGEDIRETFKTNLAQNSTVEAGSTRGNDIAFNPQNVLDGNYDTYWTMDDRETAGTLTVNFDGEKIFDIVSIQEYIPLGQRISKYNVEAYYNGGWHVFGNESECLTIGYKALVRGDITKASKIRINIKDSLAVPVINMVGVYKAVPDFELKERTDTACKADSCKPVFSLEAASYDVSKDDADIAVKIRRDGDIRREAAVRFTTSPGSAVHGEVYETTDRNITFKAGETEKTVAIKLYGKLKGERKKYFHVKLSVQDEDAALFGEYSEAVVTVIDSGAD